MIVPRCAGETEIFFSEAPADITKAKELCRECSLSVSCLTSALRRREKFGTWGGFSTPEREAILTEVMRRVRIQARGPSRRPSEGTVASVLIGGEQAPE